MWFWISASALALLVALWLVLVMFRARRSLAAGSISDVAVYRDQLRAVERDLSRGLIGDSEAEPIRIEVSRRLLAADKTPKENAGRAPSAVSYGAAALMAAFVVGGATFIYLDIGAPGDPDLPLVKRLAMADEARANSPSQAEMEASQPTQSAPAKPDDKYQQLMVKLREAVRQHPNDLRGQILLARNEAALGNYRAAHKAQAKVIELKGDQATAEDYGDYANMLIMAVQGYVSPEAEAALRKALERDAASGGALYYTGLMFAQTGRPDVAFRLWRRLLESSPANAPWVPPIRSQIEEIARLAGEKYRLPPQTDLKGPNAADVANAAQMSAAERQKMIRSMVSQLSERLNSDGGSAAEWARLIGAYGVLGARDKAASAWEKAQRVFAGKDSELATIRSAAKSAGVAE